MVWCERVTQGPKLFSIDHVARFGWIRLGCCQAATMRRRDRVILRPLLAHRPCRVCRKRPTATGSCAPALDQDLDDPRVTHSRDRPS